MVIDLHHHVGDVGPMSARGDVAPKGLEEDILTRLAYLDRNGIDQCVLMPSNGSPSPHGFEDRKRDNDAIAAYRDREPKRFVAALGSVDPKDGALALDEIDRCIEELGVAGIVWHHRFLGVPINHPFMHPLLDRLAHHGVPAFIHVIAESTFEAPWRLEALAEVHSDVTFVALDGFSGVSQCQWMTHIARRNSNIFFDTGVLISVSHMLDNFINVVGAERLLFGSDFYSTPELFKVPYPLSEIGAMELSPDDRAAILGGNARKLLGMS